MYFGSNFPAIESYSCGRADSQAERKENKQSSFSVPSVILVKLVTLVKRKLMKSTMSLPKGLEVLLKRQNLVAFLVNDDWILVRRRSYIDVYIDNQPYNSVTVLIHLATKVTAA